MKESIKVAVLVFVLVLLVSALSTMAYSDELQYQEYKCSMIESGAWGASKDVKEGCIEISNY